MTIFDKELLASRRPQFQQRKFSHSVPSQSIHIECLAEQQYFLHSSPLKINLSSKPIHLTMNDEVKPGQYRSEIIVHNKPNMDLYIKRLHMGYDIHDHLSTDNIENQRLSPRRSSLYGSLKQKQCQYDDKYRSISLPRSDFHTALHQWIDNICSNEKLMTDDDICFFIKKGEFLARI